MATTKSGESKLKTVKKRSTVEKQERKKWKELKLIKELERKRDEVVKQEQRQKEQEDIHKSAGSQYTVSIAIPGSILDNAQSPELRTYLAGQIARAASIFNIDEVVVYDEIGSSSEQKTTSGEFSGIGKKGHGTVQLGRILQYLECPQYLRKSLFPHHKDLQYAGLLNPLDAPHHLRMDEESTYREGVVLDKPVKPGRGSFANVGLYKEAQIDKVLQPGTRVTVKLWSTDSGKKLKGSVVSPNMPRLCENLYWGYSVRLASCLRTVITEAPYKNGYDLLVGTSDKGENVDDVSLPSFKHMLVVFGGLHGIEAALEADERLKETQPADLFPYYLNTCPRQGSRTIRTEEAILISLASLRAKVEQAQRLAS